MRRKAVYISSMANAQVKELLRLQKKRSERKKRGIVIAEGERLVSEIPSGLLEKVYVSESWYHSYKETQYREKLLSGFGQAEEFEPVVLSDNVFSAVTDTKTPQGVMALVHMPKWTMEDLLRPVPGEGLSATVRKPLLLLGLERLQDPGNLGTILRTAEAAGVNGIVMSADCVDLFSPKVIRSAMGAAFRIPVVMAEDFAGMIGDVQRSGCNVYAAALGKSRSYFEYSYCGDIMFLIGNEGNGLSDEAIRGADQRIYIPMEPQVESLNAATAASVLVFEARRQRTVDKAKTE